MWAVIIVKLDELIVILILSISQYKFLPFLYILQSLFDILFLQYSTTLLILNLRFFLILVVPNSVVCNLSIFDSSFFLSKMVHSLSNVCFYLISFSKEFAFNMVFEINFPL